MVGLTSPHFLLCFTLVKLLEQFNFKFIANECMKRETTRTIQFHVHCQGVPEKGYLIVLSTCSENLNTEP